MVSAVEQVADVKVDGTCVAVGDVVPAGVSSTSSTSALVARNPKAAHDTDGSHEGQFGCGWNIGSWDQWRTVCGRRRTETVARDGVDVCLPDLVGVRASLRALDVEEILSAAKGKRWCCSRGRCEIALRIGPWYPSSWGHGRPARRRQEALRRLVEINMMRRFILPTYDGVGDIATEEFPCGMAFDRGHTAICEKGIGIAVANGPNAFNI
jgi:hypothetical protein